MEQIYELDQQDPQEEEKEQYRIDLSWYESNNRSFEMLAQTRMCSDSFKGWDAVVSEEAMRQQQDPIAEIQECCSKKPVFQGPNLPVMEILFRIFLGSGNQPMSLQELEGQLKAWVGDRDGRVLSGEVLERLIAADDFYGIRPTKAGSPSS